MPRLALPVLTLLIGLLALAPSAPAMTGTSRVVGGVKASASDAPWQATVEPTGAFCGGSILDETHILTAAHCVYDEYEQAVTDPTDVTTRVGITSLGQTGQVRGVAAITVYPRYDPDLETGDVAILTIAGAPLTLSSTVQRIELTDVGWRPTIGVTTFQVSGWGSTVQREPGDDTEPVLSPDLMVAKNIQSTDACSTVYSPFDDSALLCAGQPGYDACQGDSGGPLVVQDGVPKLAGVVTGGAGCAWPGYPGFYARVAQQGIHDFIATRGAGTQLADPVFTRQPQITGDPVPGSMLTCDPGEIANAYATSVAFMTSGVVATPYRTFTPNARDVGLTFTCRVVGFGLTGVVQATSAPVTVHLAPVAPRPAPAPPAPSPYAPKADTAPPVAHVADLTCSRRRVCIIGVRVEDPAPSSGIKVVDASVETPYRTTCTVKVKGRRRHKPCTKTLVQRLRVASTPALGVYRIVTPRLRRGRHTFRISATDAAGHRQARPTTVRKTTR
jgi:hypothetical protein